MRKLMSAMTTTLASFAMACGGTDQVGAIQEGATSSQSSDLTATSDSSRGAVFTMSDDGVANSVLAFVRAENGTLTLSGTFPTGGVGSGKGESMLGSQGSVTLSRDGRHLFVVNAGSNDVSSFVVNGAALTLASRETSGGALPVSVAEHDGLVYVVNAGGTGNIFALTVDSNGMLSPLAGSSRPLSTSAAGPADIAFDRSGGVLTVTEKATQSISLYRVGRSGYASLPHAMPSAGKVPFAIAYTPEDVLIVVEAEGTPGGSTVSSYRLDGRGLELVSASVPDFQTAACWVAATDNGRFAYVANAGSGDLSSYRIDRRGRLDLVNAAAATISMGKPLDTSLSAADQFLYTLDASNHVIQAFKVADDGSLTAIGPQPGVLPSSAVGLAAQ